VAVFLNRGAERLAHDVDALGDCAAYLNVYTLAGDAAAGNHKDFPRSIVYLIDARIQSTDDVGYIAFYMNLAVAVAVRVGQNAANAGSRAAGKRQGGQYRRAVDPLCLRHEPMDASRRRIVYKIFAAEATRETAPVNFLYESFSILSNGIHSPSRQLE